MCCSMQIVAIRTNRLTMTRGQFLICFQAVDFAEK